MNDPTQIATLRNLFLTAPETASTRVIAALLPSEGPRASAGTTQNGAAWWQHCVLHVLHHNSLFL